ncbi:MAG: RNA polymerase sigma factor [Gemmatimonas sp.]
MRRHFDAVFATTRALTSVVEDAEDACQEAFARAFFRLDECAQPDQFHGWILQIARYQAMNIRRFQTLRSAVGLDAIPEPPSTAHAPDARITNDHTRLRQALDALPPKQRAVVVHHEIDGWTHHQIARKTGLSVLMSRRHLSDARASLRRMLGSILPEERADA